MNNIFHWFCVKRWQNIWKLKKLVDEIFCRWWYEFSFREPKNRMLINLEWRCCDGRSGWKRCPDFWLPNGIVLPCQSTLWIQASQRHMRTEGSAMAHWPCFFNRQNWRVESENSGEYQWISEWFIRNPSKNSTDYSAMWLGGGSSTFYIPKLSCR